MALEWLKHAFAVDGEPVAPTERQQEIVERLCRAVVGRGLTTPALLFLETVKPLNFLTAQSLVFFAPVISAVGDAKTSEELASFLEQRGAVEYLCGRLEAVEKEMTEAKTSGDDGTRVER